MTHETVAAAEDWRSVAEELAAALQMTVLRNPRVTSQDWARARAALERYERAGARKPKP